MASLKPLGTQGSDPTAKANFAQKVSGKPALTKKVSFKRLSDPESRWVKILSYGHTGSGKTYAIVGLLLAGLRVVVVSTDFGGNGLSAVYNALREMGRLDLADNIYNADFETYEELEAFVKEPSDVFPEIYEIDPDMLVWEGFTAFQQVQMNEKIMSITALGGEKENSKVSEGREEGLWAERSDWGMIRTATLRNLNRFLGLHNKVTGKKWHKYVTCLENKKFEDKVTGATAMRAPMVQGSAGSLMLPAFDIVIEMQAELPIGATDASKRKYYYNCVGHGNLAAKSRGFSLNPQEEADMQVVWGKLMAQLQTGN